MLRLPLALALLAATALPALAFDPAAMSEAERTAFDAAVRDYLVKNPEVLVEAFNVLEERRIEQEAKNDKVLLETYRKDLVEDGHSWTGGDPQGDVTLVEFFDYRCGYCKRVQPEVEALLAPDRKVRVVLKEFPILGAESELASRFAVAVQQIAGPETYKAAHDRLMAMRGAATLESLGALADELKVDRKAVLDRMNAEEVSAVLRANRQLAEQLRIAGTPSFVIGEELLRGVPEAGLAAVVDAARKPAGG